MNIIDVTAASRGNIPAYGNKHQYIAVHYLGVVGQNNKIDSGGYGAHYYIYWDGTIYKAANHDAVLWQVGTAGYYTQKHPYANNYNVIGIEMCPKCDGNSSNANDPYWYFTEATQKSCVELVKYLMQQLGVGSDHVLRHYDIVNKWCPAPYCNNNGYKGTWTWDQFKSKLTESTSTKEEEKLEQIPGNRAYEENRINYRVHQQTVGWLSHVEDGQTAGITGHRLRLEALKVDCKMPGVKIKAKAHIEKKGTIDYGYITSDTIIGTTGEKLRLEGVELEAEGLPSGMKLYVRYHIEKDGWSSWIEGGTLAGTAGLGKQLEAIQIKIQ